MANYRFIATNRGGEALVVDDYVFRLDKRMPQGKRYWKCRHTGCRVTATTVGNVLQYAGAMELHDHLNSDVAIPRKVFKSNLKDTVSFFDP